MRFGSSLQSVGKVRFLLVIGAHAIVMFALTGCPGPVGDPVGGVDDSQPNCPTCKVEWVGNQLCGAGADIECNHGPEVTTECQTAMTNWLAANPKNSGESNGAWYTRAANAVCKEMNGGMGNCECYKCGVSSTCEQYAEDFIAWCGLGKGKAGSCNAYDKSVNPEQDVRKVWQTAKPDGTACTGDNGFTETTRCGQGSNMCACFGNTGCQKVMGTLQTTKSATVSSCTAPGS